MKTQEDSHNAIYLLGRLLEGIKPLQETEYTSCSTVKFVSVCPYCGEVTSGVIKDISKIRHTLSCPVSHAEVLIKHKKDRSHE